MFMGNENKIDPRDRILTCRKIPRIGEDSDFICFNEEAAVTDFLDVHT